jgi:hypothetical protein
MESYKGHRLLMLFQWVAGQLIAIGVLRGLLGRTDQWAWRIPYAIQWVWRKNLRRRSPNKPFADHSISCSDHYRGLSGT